MLSSVQKGVIASFVFAIALVLLITFARPMDSKGHMYWSGIVRYKISSGDTGSVDVAPGKGVYEVQIQTGRIIPAYTMEPDGHNLGGCVKIRENRRPAQEGSRFKIIGESESCSAPP